MRTWSTLKNLIWLRKGVMKAASWVWKTVTGSLLHITDALAGDVSALSVAINPVQSGSGDPAPDNVRPISGWTQAKVTRTGKNLLPTWIPFPGGTNGINTSVNQDGSVRVYGTATGTGGYISAAITFPTHIDLKTNIFTVGITTNFPGASGKVLRIFFKNAKNVQGTLDILYGTSSRTSAGTTAQTDTITAQFYMGTVAGMAYDFTIYPQLEIGSTATAYEPYSGTTVTVDLDGTRYGGTLDVLTGVLTVDRAMLTFDGQVGSQDHDANKIVKGDYSDDAYSQFVITLSKSSLFPISRAELEPYAISNEFIWKFANNDGTSHFYKSGTLSVFLPVSLATTVAEFQNWLSNNPMQLILPLKTSTTIQLTPAQLATLAGENNVRADTGDTTMTYMAEA